MIPTIIHEPTQAVGLHTAPPSSATRAKAPILNRCATPDLVTRLKSVVGAAHVHMDANELTHRARTTLSHGTRPMVIVHPGCTDEVENVMRIANIFEIPVHPISTGRNWGYGDACASTDGQILLDLGRMNKILEVNSELAYAVIEPGVTQGQLADYLAHHKLPLWMDATGAGPDTSIVGNAMERGFGHSAYGNRMAQVCGMEVVLGSGQRIRTGFGRFENSKTAHVYQPGVGPALDGLFSQSGFGIVTRMGFWLQPKPASFSALFFTVKKEESIEEVIDALRPLRLQGTLKTPLHIFNDLRLLSAAQDYPWHEMKGQTPLSQDVRTQLCAKHCIEAWSGFGGLSGTRQEIASAKRLIRKALKKVSGGVRILFFNEWKMAWARRVLNGLNSVGLGQNINRLFKNTEMGFDILRGRPTQASVKGGIWRAEPFKKQSTITSHDPLDHGAGFFWISPVLPATKSDVRALNDLAKNIFAKHAFEYQVTLTMLNGRALCAVMTISFNKLSIEESQRARRCHDELIQELITAGYPPYRAGRLAMDALFNQGNNAGGLMKNIKQAFDPKNILSPGRYQQRLIRTPIHIH